MTLASLLTPAGFTLRAKGVRRPNPAKLDYASVEVLGECHLYGGTYDPAGHDYQILRVRGVDAKGRSFSYACCRRGANFAINVLDQYAAVAL